jgi:hypothetical protein
MCQTEIVKAMTIEQIVEIFPTIKPWDNAKFAKGIDELCSMTQPLKSPKKNICKLPLTPSSSTAP